MKHEPDFPDLRSALPPEPESCHRALMDAARSVKEDEPVKKFTAVLLTALLVLLTAAVAIAASGGVLSGWFQKYYHADLPKAAQEVLGSTEPIRMKAGPVEYTISEMMCDGKIAYLSGTCRLAEGNEGILYAAGNGDAYAPIGESLAKLLGHADVNAQTSYADAARLTGLPLYAVNAWLDIGDYSLVSTEMDGSEADGTGGVTLVRMLYLNHRTEAEALPVFVCAAVCQCDPETLEWVEGTRVEAELARMLPIHSVTAEKQYTPQAPTPLDDFFTVTGVHAAQTCAGAYVTIQAQLSEPMSAQEVSRFIDEWTVLDAQGNRFTTGLSMTSEITDSEGRALWQIPAEEKLDSILYQKMITVDELPESMLVTNGTVQIPVR